MTDSHPHGPEPDYDERGVPSLEYLRERVETRYATSLGAVELAEDTALTEEVGPAQDAGPVPAVEQEEAVRDAAARAKLEEIRRSLGR